MDKALIDFFFYSHLEAKPLVPAVNLLRVFSDEWAPLCNE